MTNQTTTTTTISAVKADLPLLEKIQSLIEVERSLTATMEIVEPWLTQNTYKIGNDLHFGKRVRPIPTSMEQVHEILSVSRNYASRTSAPAGWNPNAPVVGFSTPNPLPHQLRGGALAALQLERARQAERDKKRRREEEEEEEAKKAAKKQLAEESGQITTTTTTESSTNNKQHTTTSRTNNEHTTGRGGGGSQAPNQQSSRPRAARAPQILKTTMNLSDSDSSSEESSDDD